MNRVIACLGVFVIMVLVGSLLGCPQSTRADDELTLAGKDWGLVGSWTGRILVPGIPGDDSFACTFTEDEFEWAEGSQIWRGIYAVDTTSDVFKIDFVPTYTNPYARTAQGYLLVGVYEIEPRGDRQYLRFCYSKAESYPRPLSVDTGRAIVEVYSARTKEREDSTMSLMELGTE